MFIVVIIEAKDVPFVVHRGGITEGSLKNFAEYVNWCALRRAQFKPRTWANSRIFQTNFTLGRVSLRLQTKQEFLVRMSKYLHGDLRHLIQIMR